MKLKRKSLWILFLLTLIFALTEIIGGFFKLSFLQSIPLRSLGLYLPVLLLFLHAIWTLSFFRGVMFVLIASFTGFVFEFAGLKNGVVFGGNYVYGLEGIKLLTVPLDVILYWSVFIYIGYCITNSFLYWLNKDKPDKNKKDGSILALLILADSLIVVAIDLFMDPLQVQAGSWSWLEGGSYFGIPIGNFIGWALVTIITTGLFRIFEYFKPLVVSKELKPLFIIPVLGYGSLYLNFFASAVRINMINLAFIGSLIMLPIIISNLYFFFKFRINNN